MSSIRKKVLFAILGVILAVEILVMVPVFFLQNEQLNHSWLTTLSTSAEYNAQGIANLLDRLESNFLAMCEDEALPVFHKKHQYPLLQKHFKKFTNTFSMIRFINSENVTEYAWAAGNAEATSISLDTPPAQKALTHPGTVESVILYPDQGGPLIRYGYASISYFDEIQGLIGADVPVLTLSRGLTGATAHNPITNLLVDSQGRILSLPAEQGTLQRLFPEKDAFNLLAGGDEKNFADGRITVDNKQRLYRTARVPGTGWHVVSLLPFRIIEESKQTLLLTTLVITGLVFLLAMPLSWFLASSLSRPIRKMTESAKRIADGDFSHQVEVSTNDEIGVLAQTFNRMQRHLEQSWIEIKNSHNELEKRVQDRTKELQQEIIERTRSEELLKTATEQANSANLAKSEFLANMSHEVRTPLNGVLGMLQLLQETPLNNEQREYLETALHSGKNLIEIINDILDLSKIESGKIVLSTNEFDPSSLLVTVVDLLKMHAKRKGINLYYTLDKDIPYALQGDAMRIRQILFNLIGNAVKFTEQGEVHVQMNVSAAKEKPDHTILVFSISDTGIGIPKDKLGMIYEPFTQVDGSYTRKFGGTGLGLSIVNRLVKLMDGELHVESEIGKGSTFRVRIPVKTIKEKSAGKTASAATTPSPEANKAVSGLHVLLAEDDPSNQLVARRMLEKQGHTVICAANGKEALEAMARERFDVILMDVQMPEMDGIEATKELRKDARFKDVAIIALTAHAMAGDKERLLAAGMNGYLPKPLDMTELKNILAGVAMRGTKNST